jgi:hypothetical protein
LFGSCGSTAILIAGSGHGLDVTPSAPFFDLNVQWTSAVDARFQFPLSRMIILWLEAIDEKKTLQAALTWKLIPV